MGQAAWAAWRLSWRAGYRESAILIVASVVLHVGFAVVLANLPKKPKRPPVVITIRSSQPKPPPAAPPPPAPAPKALPPAPAEPAPPKVAHTSAPRPARAAAPARATAPPPAAAPSAAAAPDYGLSMGGATGAGGAGGAGGTGGGGDGDGSGGGDKPARTRAPRSDECTEPLVKAKPIDVPKAAYPQAALEAGTEGKVRVEIQIDESGAVRDAKVLTSLGAEFDAAALEAARRARFEPATRCGKAVASTRVLAMGFAL